MQQTILNINETYTVNDYPWGPRLKTTVFYKIEFSSTKGFRRVFQSIDPRTSKLCRPKNDTYSRFVYLYKDGATGHIEKASLRFDTYEDINKSCQFIAAHFDILQLTKEMNQYLYKDIRSSLNVIIGFPSPSIRIKLQEFFKPLHALLNEGLRTGENIFSQIQLNLEEIKQIEKGD